MKVDLFKPDDFRNNPYVAGLNQMGHMVLGGAIGMFLGWVAGLFVIAWEVWQYRKKGALKSDYWGDLFFWGFGIFAYQSEWFLPYVVILGAAWMGFISAKYN